MTQDFPIIDISRIDDPSSQTLIAHQITSASSQWGFLLLKSHPIPSSQVNSIFDLSKTFFSLPEPQKEPWPITTQNIGYTPALGDLKKDDKASMWFGGPPGSLLAHKASLPPFWHDHISEIQAFKSECHALVLKLLLCFALAMELPDRDFFAAKHPESNSRGNPLRLLHYPSRSSQPTGTRMVAHTDSGSVTLLFQRQAGLEILSPSGAWIKAPCIEDCILVNLGDALAFWSGRRLKATLHRVTFDSVPSGEERLSMAYFAAASPETVLEPVLREGEGTGEYVTNGIVVERGVTVGELGRKVMESIYGSGIKQEERREDIVV